MSTLAPGGARAAAYPPVAKLPHTLSAVSSASLPACAKLPHAMSAVSSASRHRYTLHRAGAVRLTGTYHDASSHTDVVLKAPFSLLRVEAHYVDVEHCKLTRQHDEQPPTTTIAAGHAWRARLLLRDAHHNPVPLARTAVVRGRWLFVKDHLPTISPLPPHSLPAISRRWLLVKDPADAVQPVATFEEPAPASELLKTTPPEPSVPLTCGVHFAGVSPRIAPGCS